MKAYMTKGTIPTTRAFPALIEHFHGDEDEAIRFLESFWGTTLRIPTKGELDAFLAARRRSTEGRNRRE